MYTVSFVVRWVWFDLNLIGLRIWQEDGDVLASAAGSTHLKSLFICVILSVDYIRNSEKSEIVNEQRYHARISPVSFPVLLLSL
jgi:hypothetical protein